MPSLSAAIATSEGVIWTGAVGYSDLESRAHATPDYYYGVGSVTKTLVACLAHQLADEGSLRLESTVRDILGDALTKDVPNAGLASVLQLIDHTSGIPSWEFEPQWIPRGRGALLEPDRIWGKAETLDYVRGRLAVNPPGGVYDYSNTNYTLLGLVIEKVAEDDIVVAIRKRILEPLGLTEIKLEGFESTETCRLPSRYHFSTAEFVQAAGLSPFFKPVALNEPAAVPITNVCRSNLSTEWAAGGLVATARQLADYGRALRDGLILGRGGMQRMLSFRQSSDVETSAGLRRERFGDTVTIGHAGGVLGFSAWLGWIENEDVVLALLSNVGNMHSGERAYSVRKLLHEQAGLLHGARDLARGLSLRW